MEYLSTRNSHLREGFRNVLYQGLSKDGGLFLPSKWPRIDIHALRDKKYEEVALDVISPYVGNEISDNELYNIIKYTYKNFSHKKIAPLVNVDLDKYILELFYGPTLAFKDYAMQFLGNLFSYKMQENKNKIVILGATSGDTGSAAIEAFKGKENINVFILHPYQKVSSVQRKQMTTVMENNIFNIAIKGTFDDCQKIVKDLFLDDEIQKKTSLTAINSINWARIVAQVVYFFWGYLQLQEEEVSFIVPSGNFGNIFAAHVSQKMGLPIKNLHIATNQNDILHNIISSGQMILQDVKETYSPSMDIQISSNFERQIFESVQLNCEEVKKIMNEFKSNKQYIFNPKVHKSFQDIYNSTCVSDEDTLKAIKIFQDKYDYLADPHTATGLHVLNNIKVDHPFISLACAHPAKFGEAIKKATGKIPSFPKEINNIFDKQEKMTILSNSSREVKSLILKTL